MAKFSARNLFADVTDFLREQWLVWLCYIIGGAFFTSLAALLDTLSPYLELGLEPKKGGYSGVLLALLDPRLPAALIGLACVPPIFSLALTKIMRFPLRPFIMDIRGASTAYLFLAFGISLPLRNGVLIRNTLSATLAGLLFLSVIYVLFHSGKGDGRNAQNDVEIRGWTALGFFALALLNFGFAFFFVPPEILGL